MRNIIENKLISAFDPVFLDVVDESHMHGGGALTNTHFKVTIVSNVFNEKRLLQRHRSINQLLSEELSGSVHALALHTYTPIEWEKKGNVIPTSPDCRGGSKGELVE